MLRLHRSNESIAVNKEKKISDNRDAIVILADSLRIDHLGCYGNQWVKTPNIDRLASESAVFEYAYGEGLPTLPFRTSAFTGRFTLPFRGWQALRPTDVLLSEILWNKQCNSAIVSDCYHLHEPPHNNYGRGFRNVYWIRGQEHDPYIIDPKVKIDPERFFPVWQYSEWEKKRYKLFEQYLRNTSHWKGEEDTACKWLDSLNDNESFFLWLDFFDPHAPYDPRFPPYDQMYHTGWTGKKILWIEGMANDFPEDAVRQMRANYAGIFLSDHGEPLGEHGIITKMRPWPYDELSHIPLIVRYPDIHEKGIRIKSFVQTPDIPATILDFMGIEAPRTFQGKSLLPIITGEKTENYKFAISGFYNRSWSIRNEKWSYYVWITGRTDPNRPWKEWFFQYSDKHRRSELYKLEGKISTPHPTKYQIEKDVYEKDNLVDEYPEKAEEMELKLRNFIHNLTKT